MGGLIFFALIALWISFCVWVVRKFVRWLPLTAAWQRLLVGVLSVVVLFFLPLIDEIIGKMQFDKLCREEAGVKIYGKLELGPEFFNADGSTNLINEMGNLDEERFKSLFRIVDKPSQKISSIADIVKGGLIIQSVGDQRAVLEETEFGFHGGWLAYDRHPWLFETGCTSRRRRLGDLVNLIIERK